MTTATWSHVRHRLEGLENLDRVDTPYGAIGLQLVEQPALELASGGDSQEHSAEAASLLLLVERGVLRTGTETVRWGPERRRPRMAAKMASRPTCSPKSRRGSVQRLGSPVSTRPTYGIWCGTPAQSVVLTALGGVAKVSAREPARLSSVAARIRCFARRFP